MTAGRLNEEASTSTGGDSAARDARVSSHHRSNDRLGQVTEAMIVYDAPTGSGGSGGPVFGLDGEVVAVNAAILEQFSGSNLGVPVRHVLALLAGLDSEQLP